MSKDYSHILNIALNYGGRDEIVHAANEVVAAGLPITEENISKFLYTAGTPDPDLIIRTGGEMRVSNFLIWQGAYSELVVLDTLWPDFREESFYEAIIDYQKRERRFGKTSEQLV